MSARLTLGSLEADFMSAASPVEREIRAQEAATRRLARLTSGTLTFGNFVPTLTIRDEQDPWPQVQNRKVTDQPLEDQRQGLVSFWIEFGDWPGELRSQRLPPYPRECGVTGTDLQDALDLIQLGFYGTSELAPVLRVRRDVARATGEWAGKGEIPKPTGKRGIWWPRPWLAARTVIA